MLLVFAGMSAKAQETRPMTESELAFYQKLMNLIKEAFPHGNFGKWELRSHKERIDQVPGYVIVQLKLLFNRKAFAVEQVNE